MKKNIYIIVGLGIIIIVGSWLLFSNNSSQLGVEERENSNVLKTAKSKAVEAEKKAKLTINDGEKEPKTFEVEFVEGETAFDLLKNKTEELNMVLKTKTYDIGIMIEAIGDKENGQGGKYWLYYINGEMPMVSADKKIIKPGDKVEFKFEKSPF